MTRYSAPNWQTRPISATCEFGIAGVRCHAPTAAAYPAMGCGWMALCDRHAAQHRPHGIFEINDLIESGEIVAGAM